MTSGPDPIDVAVGARVRLLRKHRDLSQSALADALGLTFQQVQKYERGANRISASMLVRIAARLETTVGQLIGEEGGGKPPEAHYANLQVPGATDMLTIFAALSPELRRALIIFSRTLAREAPLKVV